MSKPFILRFASHLYILFKINSKQYMDKVRMHCEIFSLGFTDFNVFEIMGNDIT